MYSSLKKAVTTFLSRLIYSSLKDNFSVRGFPNKTKSMNGHTYKKFESHICVYMLSDSKYRYKCGQKFRKKCHIFDSGIFKEEVKYSISRIIP